jgi:hypothetical protein
MPKRNAKYGTAAARWAGVGPYYAMFPAAFAERVIRRHTEPGDVVLDPFAGRGTSVFSAAVHGRRGIGMEINPVGWVYAQAKLWPASKESVIERLSEIAGISQRYHRAAKNMPLFFRCCYRQNVLQFLIAARINLDWKNRKADWTAMAFLLVNLHGKRNDSLSNQMRQTKSMSPSVCDQMVARTRHAACGSGSTRIPPQEDRMALREGHPRIDGQQSVFGRQH